jgi:hypothetical protein
MSGLALLVRGYACLGRMTTALMPEHFLHLRMMPTSDDVFKSCILAKSQKW